MTDELDLEAAISNLDQAFPIPGYVSLAREALSEVGAAVQRQLKPGAHVLDCGAGRCAKAALLQMLGFEVTAYDDLGDPHLTDAHRDEIRRFAQAMGVQFVEVSYNRPLPFEKEQFDLVMLHDVLEHMHDSPRTLLNTLLELAKPQGLLFITVPSAVNIRKRLAVLRGRTNLPRFGHFFWHPDPWRGHVREYVADDLRQLCGYLNLEIVELRTAHHMIEKIPKPVRPLYRAITTVFPGWRDTWMLVARKRPDHRPAATPPAEFDINFGRIGYWDS
jgi:SAM-dependent methyltransferase